MNLLNLWTFFFLLPLAQLHCQARPARRATIQQKSTIEDVRFSIDPWLLRISSKFEIDFQLSSDITRIRLDLHPSRTIVRPAAEIILAEPEGRDDSFDSLENSPLLSDGNGLIFEGDALLFDRKRRVWRKAGWGRIVIEHPRPYLFEGVFNLDGNNYHLILSSSYHEKQHSAPPMPGSTHIVVWNEADEIEDDSDSVDLEVA